MLVTFIVGSMRIQVGDQIGFSWDCFLRDLSEGLAAFLKVGVYGIFGIQKTEMSFANPSYIFALSLILFALYSVLASLTLIITNLVRGNTNKRSIIVDIKAALVIIFYSEAYKIMVGAFNIFSCEDLSESPGRNQLFLEDDLTLPCSGDAYKNLKRIAIGVLCTVLALIFVIAMSIRILAKSEIIGEDNNLTKVYGYLLQGFKEKHAVWEFIIVLEKVFLVVSVSLLRDFLVNVQTITVLIILVVVGAVQNKWKPYLDPELDKIESASCWSLAMITLFAHYYYNLVQSELSTRAEIMLLIFGFAILCSVFLFLIPWIKGYSLEAEKILNGVWDKLKRMAWVLRRGIERLMGCLGVSVITILVPLKKCLHGLLKLVTGCESIMRSTKWSGWFCEKILNLCNLLKGCIDSIRPYFNEMCNLLAKCWISARRITRLRSSASSNSSDEDNKLGESPKIDYELINSSQSIWASFVGPHHQYLHQKNLINTVLLTELCLYKY
eukprot:TRINITY_DN10968_c0_g1_i1.p1 TRINITY_DN10968_c0_g1~~TRINITY_DN10968_c0_g1_i1.p1  ORF type:complete len:496 (+),score=18.32 TRINITY_DN10968_c0_g1_i1:976-2463(+)